MSDEFRQAIMENGFTPPDYIQPGRFHRFPGAGKNSSNKAGWCMQFEDGEGGIYGDWSTGFQSTWKSKRELSPVENAAFRRQVKKAILQAEQERNSVQIEAAQEAKERWDNAEPEAGNHRYLVNKEISAHGVRTDGSNLLVPMRDADGKLWSIQSIDPEGKKLFHKSSRIKGCYYPIGKPDGVICLAEGFATAATIREATGHAVAVCFNANNLQPVAEALSRKYSDMKYIVCADDDYQTDGNPGIDKALQAAAAVDGHVVKPDFGRSRPDGATDFNDMAAHMGAEAVAQVINGESQYVNIWPEITPLDTSLPEVEPFRYSMLPDGLSAWVKDIVERTQCPPDFVAVTVMVSLATVTGRKVAIHPKQHDDWLVVPNLWGALIGRPSAMKTPAMAEGMRPLKRLATEARRRYQDALNEYEVDRVFAKQQALVIEQDIKSAIKSKDQNKINHARRDAAIASNDAPEEPVEQRYIVNDATIEKLGELLNQNPNGLLLERDEMTGWLKSLDREDRANDRAFYLECFNGTGRYTYDRIGRGTLHIESTTVSLIGGLQPSKLRPYVWHAINHGAGDDGLIQRFQLAVYPDDVREWKNIDRWPDNESKQAAFEIFKRLDELPPAPPDAEGRVQGVRFDQEGQQVFNAWREDLEHKIREPGIHPAIEAHLTKYRSLMPSLALIINEVEQGHRRPVTETSAKKAAAWCQYLESHAIRIYGGAVDPVAQDAELVLARRDKLPDGFTAREVQRKGWAGLSDKEHVNAALNELVECGFLRADHKQPAEAGGRPTWCYFWNPNIDRTP